MDKVIPILFLILWVGSWRLGWKIKKWKNRWLALYLTIAFPFIGLLIALFLDQRCPHCWKCCSMAADVCPHCGRTIKSGKVDVDVKSVAGIEVKKPEVTKASEGKIVYDPETHQYVKR